MRKLLHLIPLAVAYMEYQALVLALGFTRFAGDGEIFTAFHGLLKVGENFSFYDVPGVVRILHVIALFLSLSYFFAVAFFGYINEADEGPAEPTTF